MEHHCLSRNEYRCLIYQLIYEQQLEDELEDELKAIIERAQYYWDVNIIGINYFLSIIVEQIMKRANVDRKFIDEIYNLKDKLSFTIDELDYKFIDELFVNNLPDSRNNYTALIEGARKTNDIKRIAEMEIRRAQSFEEDILRVIENYYETEIYH